LPNNYRGTATPGCALDVVFDFEVVALDVVAAGPVLWGRAAVTAGFAFVAAACFFC